MNSSWNDFSAALGCGVYVLRLHGRVAFVGKARKCMLARIATHRALAGQHIPAWSPLRGVQFDQLEVLAVHPDRLDEVYESTYAELMNRPQFQADTFTPLRARVR